MTGQIPPNLYANVLMVVSEQERLLESYRNDILHCNLTNEPIKVLHFGDVVDLPENPDLIGSKPAICSVRVLIDKSIFDTERMTVAGALYWVSNAYPDARCFMYAVGLVVN